MVEVLTPAQAAAPAASFWSDKMMWFSLILGLVGIIAILGLVFGAIAYANTIRSAKMISDELRRCRGGSGGGAGDGSLTVELFSQALNVTVEPGQTDPAITAVSIDNESAQVPVGTEFTLSLTVARQSNAPEAAASGTVSFAGNSSNFTIPAMVGVVEVPVNFLFAQVQGGAMINISLSNTGTIPLRASRVRILARQPYAGTTHSRGAGKVAPAPKKKRGLKLFGSR